MKKLSKIGIWGFGLTGKSALAYYIKKRFSCEVMDKRILGLEEKELLERYGVIFCLEEDKKSFFERNEYIFVSQGIDITNYYTTYKYKLILELDFFHAHAKIPFIAITGSVGKTSVTHLLSQLSTKANSATMTGGNIGTPTFDILLAQEKAQYNYAILEVSSFQLEHCTQFAPDIAVWTNFYPNHLDRHGTEKAYFQAKSTMFAHQEEHQTAIIFLPLARQLCTLLSCTQRLVFFSLHRPSAEEMVLLPSHASYCYVHDGWIVMQTAQEVQKLIATQSISHLSFLENWVAIAATWYTLGLPFSVFDSCSSLTLPEHRLEYLGTLGGITFYNDSKSTTPTSTLAALSILKNQLPILFVGGLSKGVDRMPFIKELIGKITAVYCFGKEAEQLASWATLYGLKAFAYTTLDEAFVSCMRMSAPGTIILFSPAGSSYDLFTNYQERGTYFKKLVSQHMT